MTEAQNIKIPKLLQQLFYAYPTLHVLEVLTCILLFVTSRQWEWILALTIVLYLQSPIIWRILRAMFGQPSGQMFFGKKVEDGCMWYVLMNLQYLYIAFEQVERVLLIIPGLYSAWLRLWGSKIGKKIMWTPEVKLYDRTHLNFGDRILFGSRVVISCHLVNKKDRSYSVHIAEVKIGSDSFIGYDTCIGPGVDIGDKCMTEVRSIVLPYTQLTTGSRHARP